jgi:hypothetical protein
MSCQGRQVSENKWEFGFNTIKTGSGLIYQQNGTTNVNFNGGLKLPQKRPFLGPFMFNGGCSQMYCNNDRAIESNDTKIMFDNLFNDTM